MWYAIVLISLFAAELLYFRVADHFNIIDKPNQRSSHQRITLRGGGIIVLLSVWAFFFSHHLFYPLFVTGLTAIAIISLADDIRPQSNKLRLFIHFTAVALMLKQLGVFSDHWYTLLLGFIMIIGIINAYNFMDGINGMTTAYSFTVLAAAFALNRELRWVEDDLIIYLALGNLVFAFFNFRTRAKCFAGDVGSVSMAFCVLFIITGLMLKAQTLFFIMLFAVYGVDTVLTIVHRLILRENIFEAHRRHLYQYLANEMKWPHLLVSTVYFLVQACVSIGVLMLWQQPVSVQFYFSLGVCLGLGIIYVVVKRRILKQVA